MRFLHSRGRAITFLQTQILPGELFLPDSLVKVVTDILDLPVIEEETPDRWDVSGEIDAD